MGAGALVRNHINAVTTTLLKAGWISSKIKPDSASVLYFGSERKMQARYFKALDILEAERAPLKDVGGAHLAAFYNASISTPGDVHSMHAKSQTGSLKRKAIVSGK